MLRALSPVRLIPNPYTHLRPLPNRQITTAAAKSMLGFTKHCIFTVRELRHAYFEAAKLHHPDVLKQQEQENPMYDFRDITDAYEHLLNSSNDILMSSPRHPNEQQPIITHDEEAEYRTACLDILGISAEIVEESKKNPMFRQWLMGKTDAAMHWKMFLSQYGGLAEKLMPRVQVAEGEKVRRKVDGRRKRRR